MGHIQRKRPRRGSLQYWHRQRAKKETPRVRNWAKSKEVKVLGFAGYKAGMTHVHFVDNKPKSPTKGEELQVPVTILEAPSIKIFGFRLLSKTTPDSPSNVLFDVLSDSLDVELKRKLTLPKKRKEQEMLKKAEELLDKSKDIRVLAYTQPKFTSIGKKKPEILELGVGGNDVKAKFEYAKSILGKELGAKDIFKEGEFVDIHSVTKGKGFQGPIKRFGVRLESHKSNKGRRKVGTLGNWSAKTWRVAHAGQMGYHARTDYNKQILKISTIQEQNVNPDGGFVKYGLVKDNYILISGSVPGPKKRLIRLVKAIRSKKKYPEQAPALSNISTRSQQ